MLVDRTGITVGKGSRILAGIMVRKYRVIRALHYTNVYKRGLAQVRKYRVIRALHYTNLYKRGLAQVRKYRVIRALHYTNLYKRGLASPRLPRASHNLKPPLVVKSNYGNSPAATRISSIVLYTQRAYSVTFIKLIQETLPSYVWYILIKTLLDYFWFEFSWRLRRLAKQPSCDS
jgi:hypothetical protein